MQPLYNVQSHFLTALPKLVKDTRTELTELYIIIKYCFDGLSPLNTLSIVGITFTNTLLHKDSAKSCICKTA